MTTTDDNKNNTTVRDYEALLEAVPEYAGLRLAEHRRLTAERTWTWTWAGWMPGNDAIKAATLAHIGTLEAGDIGEVLQEALREALRRRVRDGVFGSEYRFAVDLEVDPAGGRLRWAWAEDRPFSTEFGVPMTVVTVQLAPEGS